MGGICAGAVMAGALEAGLTLRWAKAGAAAARVSVIAASSLIFDIGKLLIEKPACSGIRNIFKTGFPRQYRLGMGSMPGRRRGAGANWQCKDIAMTQKNLRNRARPIHPWPVRVTHWINAVAIVVMIGSGWQIYDGSPLFNFTFPPLITIGAWLGAGIAWHLAFMWLLVANGICYFCWAAASGHFRKFWPISPRAVLREVGLALTFRLPHRKGIYNAVQRLLYTGVLFAGIVIVISGLGIWKPVQLWFFTDLCGGYFIARYVHFFAMAAIAAFMVIHLLLVALVPKSLPPMLTGGRVEP